MDKRVFIVIGVAGSGKTTVGKLLAEALECGFSDADEFHSQENKNKMSAGVALTDSDRAPWLAAMSAAIAQWLAAGSAHVLACSALKARYRAELAHGKDSVRFVYLKAAGEMLAARLAARPNHFMKANMLASQFETLEEPTADQALIIDAALPPVDIVAAILNDGL